MQNHINVFEEYYSKTPFKKILWNQLSEKEIYEALCKLGVPYEFSIVSLGCGTGQKEVYAAKNGYKDIVGIDISKSAIEQAKLLAKNMNAYTKFHEENILNLTKSSFLKDFCKPDLILDWMSFHSVDKKYRAKYLKAVDILNPRWFLIRTFSKKDSDYEKTKKDKLPNIGAGEIHRHFFSFEDLAKLFNSFYPILQFDTKEYFDPKKFIDRKIAAKITILFLNKKRVFS